jgi:hypothetical protein
MKRFDCRFGIRDCRLPSVMDKAEFKKMAKTFAINVVLFCKMLPYDFVIKQYIAQLVRCSSSVPANYRAA